MLYYYHHLLVPTLRYIIVGRSVEQLVRDGAVWVNLVRVPSMEERVDSNNHLLAGNITLIRIGKYISL